MHLLTYLGTGLSLVVLSNSLPTSQPRKEHCNALIETSPWHVSDIVVYNADSTASVGSSIHFHVSDTNLGLEFDTSCGVSMPTHTGSKPEDAQGWHPCEDGRVRFFYQLGSLQLSRSYYDDCLGPPPYNGGVFYGGVDTHFQVTPTDGAMVWTQTAMEVPVTSQT